MFAPLLLTFYYVFWGINFSTMHGRMGWVVFAMFCSLSLLGQGVLIGPSGQAPHGSAYLEVRGNQGGFLMPRLTTAQRNSIASPAQGLQIFNLTTDCIETYFSTGWQPTACGCNAPPAAPSGFSVSSSSLCLGDTINLSVQPVPFASTYQWTPPAGLLLISGQDSLTARFLVNAPFSGSVQVVATNGCGSSAPLSQTLSSSIPSAAFSPISAAVNQAQVFQPATLGGTYSWTFSNGSPTTSTAAAPSITWSQPGTFAVTLTVTNAQQCSATLLQNITVSNCITGGSLTLTPCGATGRSGPSQSQCNNSYGPGVVTVQNGMQLWTVPNGVCTLTIDANGAQGVDRSSAQGGRGARMRGTFAVTPGQVLRIAVGQEGVPYGSNSGAGGGGTFVVDHATQQPLVVAGGGGGGFNTFPGGHGLTTLNGGGPNPGINGQGGITHNSTPVGGAGGGFFSDGSGSPSNGSNGQGFLNGALGGPGSGGAGDGGFGGGGSQNNGGSNVGGGGGGYSGGGSSGSTAALSTGGGGSINNGTNPLNQSGVRAGNGQVILTW
jgi:hypothetical protein